MKRRLFSPEQANAEVEPVKLPLTDSLHVRARRKVGKSNAEPCAYAQGTVAREPNFIV